METDAILARLGVTMADIEAFCKKWDVVEFAIFGSALREDFRPDSDVDVLLVYDDAAHRTLFDLIEMQTEFGQLVRRPVDILTRRSVEGSHNWMRRASILDSARTLYAA
jgi:predicted nucleotidyltransferase